MPKSLFSLLSLKTSQAATAALTPAPAAPGNNHDAYRKHVADRLREIAVQQALISRRQLGLAARLAGHIGRQKVIERTLAEADAPRPLSRRGRWGLKVSLSLERGLEVLEEANISQVRWKHIM